VVSILPAEYDMISEVKEFEEDYNPEDMEKYKSMCCCVIEEPSSMKSLMAL